MSGPNPISYTEIEAYIRLRFPMGYDQVQRLVRYVEVLDDLFLEDYAERQKRGSKK